LFGLESSVVDSVTIVTDFFGSFSAPMVVVVYVCVLELVELLDLLGLDWIYSFGD